MQVILCTGDSHTCGQGADNILSRLKPKYAGYNTNGKGLGMVGNYEVPSYVNLLRNYVTQHTRSRTGYTSGQKLASHTGYPLIRDAVKLAGEFTLPNEWDLSTVCFVETQEEVKVRIYLDEQLYTVQTLYAEIPRYNGWSFRHIMIHCKGVQTIRLVPDGNVFISYIQYDAGEYAVLNSGVGSCTSKRYHDECFSDCVEAFKPAIIVAEAHTINDWLNYETAHQHSQQLQLLLERMCGLGAKLLFTTVSPIQGNLVCPSNNLDYEDFMAEAKKAGQMGPWAFADSNAAFHQVLDGLSPQEQFDRMYVDSWHVNAQGHKIYADTIWTELKKML